MKKIVLLISVLVLALALVGCEDDIIEKGLGNNNAVTQDGQLQSQPVTEVISQERAKEIALNHANLKIEDVPYIDADLDRDDGIIKYEVDCSYCDFEYEYEINAQTGDIISHDKDRD